MSASHTQLLRLSVRVEAERRQFPDLAIELQLSEAAEALATALKEPDSDSDYWRAVQFAERAVAAARFRY